MGDEGGPAATARAVAAKVAEKQAADKQAADEERMLRVAQIPTIPEQQEETVSFPTIPEQQEPLPSSPEAELDALPPRRPPSSSGEDRASFHSSFRSSSLLRGSRHSRPPLSASTRLWATLRGLDAASHTGAHDSRLSAVLAQRFK